MTVRESRRDRVSAADLEAAVLEARVAQAVTEGVERFLDPLGEPAVADLGALVVSQIRIKLN
ncbi:MAG TPA: hypothetical protein VKB80_08845 [Kofleriaceae bacterium]|nr:hypothetical protein [Kofleriaceae bacterium]